MNALPGLSREASLLGFALLAVIGLVVLIARFKLNAFVALILASVFVGLCSGLELSRIGQSFADGVGGVLGSIAAIIGLGTILGKLLSESGGAPRGRPLPGHGVRRESSDDEIQARRTGAENERNTIKPSKRAVHASRTGREFP